MGSHTTSAPTDVVGAGERFMLREVIAEWNRRLDNADAEGVRELCAPGVELSFDGRDFHGADAVEEFVAAFGSTPEVTRRTHVNHLQAWREDGTTRARSFTMIVELVETTSTFGVGAASGGWLGYCEDRFVEIDGRTAVRSRAFRRWGGETLQAFPKPGAVIR